jgi:DNA repair protein RecO (recombination protein O)
VSRVEQQSGWVLHRRPWRESSLILEVFCREHGRLGLVAKGARAARSPWRGLAEPFAPLSISWSRRGELGTLTELEADGARLHLPGRALWCGLYANELLLTLTGRDEALPELFDAYAQVLAGLACSVDHGFLLRRFELALLTSLGVVPDLDHDAVNGDPIVSDGLYHLRPEAGLVPVAAAGRQVFSGRAVLALRAGQPPEPAVAREARALTRLLLDFQLDGRTLKTRELFRQAGQAGRSLTEDGEQR